MIVIVAAVVAVAVLAGAALLATGVLSTARDRASRSGLGVIAAAVGVALVVVLIGLLLAGFRGAGDGDASDASRPTTPTSPTIATTATRPASTAEHGLLTLQATTPAEPPAPVPLVGDLADGDVLRIRAVRLRPGARGRVRQCRSTTGGLAACTNSFPVQVGADGTAVFQYELRADTDECGASDTCAVAVTDDDGATALAYTIFGEPAPPPAGIALSPRGPYRAGQRVSVTVERLAPRATVGLAFCAPRCGAAGRVVADATGRARGFVTLRSRCSDSACTVALVGAGARDTARSLRFVAGPTPTHNARRILAGLLGAAVLLLIAWYVARRTDWRVPSEAATPQLDTAEL